VSHCQRVKNYVQHLVGVTVAALPDCLNIWDKGWRVPWSTTENCLNGSFGVSCTCPPLCLAVFRNKKVVPSNILYGFQVHQYILAIYNNYLSFAVEARGFAAVLTKVGWLSRGQNSYDSVWGLSTPVFPGMDGAHDLSGFVWKKAPFLVVIFRHIKKNGVYIQIATSFMLL